MTWPSCFGLYSRNDVECNGTPTAVSEADKAPCLVRDCCVALKATGRGEQLLEVRSGRAHAKGEETELQAHLEALVSSLDIREGRMRRAAGGVSPDSGLPRPEVNLDPILLQNAARKRSRERERKSRARAAVATRALAGWFLERLSVKTERPVSSGPSAAIGELYVVDRPETPSRHLAVYCRLPRGRSKPVAALFPRTTLGLEIRTVDFRPLLPKTVRIPLELVEVNYRSFSLAAVDLDRRATGYVAEMISRSVASGILNLPPCEAT